jgi:hypothetical protein
MRVDARTRSAAELDEFLAGFDFPVITHLRDTQVYVYCARDGLSVFDLPRFARRAGLGAVETVDALDRSARAGTRRLARPQRKRPGTSRCTGRGRRCQDAYFANYFFGASAGLAASLAASTALSAASLLASADLPAASADLAAASVDAALAASADFAAASLAATAA